MSTLAHLYFSDELVCSTLAVLQLLSPTMSTNRHRPERCQECEDKKLKFLGEDALEVERFSVVIYCWCLVVGNCVDQLLKNL